MLTFAPAPDQGGQVGYGLGIEQRVFPGGVEAIGHLGGAGTYTAYVARLHPHGETIALALNWPDDPTPLLIPASAGARGHASVRFDERKRPSRCPHATIPADLVLRTALVLGRLRSGALRCGGRGYSSIPPEEGRHGKGPEPSSID